MVTELCRVCLNKTGVFNIFDKQDELRYNEKIMNCVNIIIAKGDGMPDSICETCAGELSMCYEFINKCKTSDTALRCLSTDNQANYDLTEENVKEELTDDLTYSTLDQKADLSDDFTYPSFDSSNLVNELGVENTEKIKNRKSDPVTCDVCGLKETCYSTLESHMQEHSKDRPFICNMCDSAFILEKMLYRHMKSRHNKILHKRNKFKGYSKKPRPKMGPIQCVMCGLMVQSKSAMEAHSRTHTGEKPFRCDACDMAFNVKGSLKKHVETHHLERERKFICETCGCSFFRKCEIIAHIRRHTDERPYSCELCPKSFRQISSLIRHKYSHTGERRQSCPICLKKFYDKSAIRKHLSVHSDERKYSCHLCNKSVKSKSSLATHLKLHSNEKQNICNFCGMAFSLKGNLQTHIRRKHSEKSGPCLVCMKTFPDLEEHMRKHTGEKPFACKLCDQAYATKRSLSYHIIFKHENAEKFKCTIGDCTKTFPTGKLLEVHLVKYHTNHTPYLCPHCSRGFFRTSDLTRHLKGSHMDTMKVTLNKNVLEIK